MGAETEIVADSRGWRWEPLAQIGLFFSVSFLPYETRKL